MATGEQARKKKLEKAAKKRAEQQAAEREAYVEAVEIKTIPGPAVEVKNPVVNKRRKTKLTVKEIEETQTISAKPGDLAFQGASGLWAPSEDGAVKVEPEEEETAKGMPMDYGKEPDTDPPVTMAFSSLKFRKGLNVTVRQGAKWLGFTGAVVIAGTNGRRRAGLGVILDTFEIGFEELNISDTSRGDTAIRFLEHDSDCRDFLSLVKVMKRVYPDFSRFDAVTVVYFTVEPDLVTE